MQRLIIGIAGGTGAGKTTIARSIVGDLPATSVALIEHDMYYLDHSALPEDARAQVNYDHPDSLDNALLIAHLDALRERFDIKIFVDTPADIRLLRRIRRDMERRGRTFDDVRRQYARTVRPMHEAFVEPSRRFADLIIPEGGNQRVAIEMVVDRIRRQLAS